MQHTRLFLAGLLVLGAACSSDNTTTGSNTSDDAAITSDVASAAADGFAEDVDMMGGMDGGIGNALSGSDNLVSPGGNRPSLTGCSFAGGSFTCPPVTKNGLTVTRTITLFDATGATQSEYDSLTTASIHVVADLAGDVTRGPWAATVARHRDFTITGLAGTETTRTANGTGNETVSKSRVTQNDSTRSYDITGSSLIHDVVFPVRASDGDNGWPLSGTITRNLTITLTSGPHAGRTTTRTVVITFNGDSAPTGTVDGTSFTMNLAAHTATKR